MKSRKLQLRVSEISPSEALIPSQIIASFCKVYRKYNGRKGGLASVLKETIPYVELTVETVKLRDLGYDRFRFQFNRANRKLIDLVAWKYYERPDLRKEVKTLQVIPDLEA